MGRKPESKLRARIVAALRRRGAWARSIKSDADSAGLPDVAAVVAGRALWLEVKTPENEKGATTLQERELTAIRAAGGLARVVRSVDEAVECVELVLELVGRGGRLAGQAASPLAPEEKATDGVTGRGRLQDNRPVKGGRRA